MFRACKVRVPGARFQGMSPSQGLGVGQITSDSRNEARLDQGAELEVDGVHVGWPVGEMAEAAIAVAATKRPLGTLVDRHPDLRVVAAKLAEDKDGVEAGVDIPVGLLDVPAAI